MSALWARIRSEPAMVATFLNWVIAIAAERGLSLTPTEQTGLFLVATFLLGVAVRQQVEPLSKQSPAAKAARKSSRKEQS